MSLLLSYLLLYINILSRIYIFKFTFLNDNFFVFIYKLRSLCKSMLTVINILLNNTLKIFMYYIGLKDIIV